MVTATTQGTLWTYIVTATTLKEVQQLEKRELQKLITKIKRDEFKKDLKTITEKQGPAAAMSKAIGSYVDNNGKQLEIDMRKRYKNKSSDEMKQSINCKTITHIWGCKYTIACILYEKKCKTQTKHVEKKPLERKRNRNSTERKTNSISKCPKKQVNEISTKQCNKNCATPKHSFPRKRKP